MGNAISSALTDSWLASHQKRVQKWLDGATKESVLDALTTSFFSCSQGYGGLPAARDAKSNIKEMFGAYGSVDPVDQKRYWHEKDLGHFLSNRFPGPELTASLPILWRCFHFHAYFPFTQNSQRLDYSAFQRAIGFLAAEGNLRLGENADGVTMVSDGHPKDMDRASKRLWIMFRSLSTPSPSSLGDEKIGTLPTDLPDTEEDLMDVLALTQPDNPCIMPAPIEELRPHAKRISSSSTPYTYSTIPQSDFLSLLKLMLSVQLDKPEWGPHEPYFHTGRISIRPDPHTLQGAASAILRRLTSSEKMDMDWHVFKNFLGLYLPDFVSQFRLIFTSLLSPTAAVSQTFNQPTPVSTIPVPYAQCLNFFLHPPLNHPKRHAFEDFARQEAHYALQTTQPAYSASPPTLNITDLIAALSPIKAGTLLLITGEAFAADTHGSTRVTIGACMPTPWDLERERAFRASPPQKLHRYTPNHMLFQLEPCLETLHPEANTWIMDLIHITHSNPESSKKGGLRFGAEGASSLTVDFDTGIATLQILPTSQHTPNTAHQTETLSPPNTAYHPIDPSPNEPKPSNRITSLRLEKLEIYNLGGHATAPFEEQLAEKPRLRPASPVHHRAPVFAKGAASDDKPSVPQVGEEELKRRIRGFGPGGETG